MGDATAQRDFKPMLETRRRARTFVLEEYGLKFTSGEEVLSFELEPARSQTACSAGGGGAKTVSTSRTPAALAALFGCCVQISQHVAGD